MENPLKKLSKEDITLIKHLLEEERLVNQISTRSMILCDLYLTPEIVNILNIFHEALMLLQYLSYDYLAYLASNSSAIQNIDVLNYLTDVNENISSADTTTKPFEDYLELIPTAQKDLDTIIEELPGLANNRQLMGLYLWKCISIEELSMSGLYGFLPTVGADFSYINKLTINVNLIDSETDQVVLKEFGVTKPFTYPVRYDRDFTLKGSIIGLRLTGVGGIGEREIKLDNSKLSLVEGYSDKRQDYLITSITSNLYMHSVFLQSLVGNFNTSGVTLKDNKLVYNAEPTPLDIKGIMTLQVKESVYKSLAGKFPKVGQVLNNYLLLKCKPLPDSCFNSHFWTDVDDIRVQISPVACELTDTSELVCYDGNLNLGVTVRNKSRVPTLYPLSMFFPDVVETPCNRFLVLVDPKSDIVKFLDSILGARNYVLNISSVDLNTIANYKSQTHPHITKKYFDFILSNPQAVPHSTTYCQL